MFDDYEDYKRRVQEAAMQSMHTASWNELYYALENLTEDVSSGALDSDSLDAAIEIVQRVKAMSVEELETT